MPTDEQSDSSARGVGSGNHVVAAGECVFSIAARHGVRWEEIWNHPGNKTLRGVRLDPGVLLTGDLVHVPRPPRRDHRIAPGGRYGFHGAIPQVEIRLKLTQQGQTTRARSFTLTANGERKTGPIEDGAEICISVAANARVATLCVHHDDWDEEITLDVGGLEPVYTLRGIQARLANLGYDVGPIDGDLGPRTRRALAAFQAAVGLPANSECDAPTRTALRDAHGC